MKNLTMSFGRRLGLVAVILAAGFCYSYGLQGAPVPLMGDRGTVLAEAAVPENHSGAEQQSILQATAPTAESVSETSVRGICFVHVCGEVNRPGVYELEEGQRICDAVERAGGFTEGAAADYLNLAEPVWDGMKLTVPNQNDIPKQEWAPEHIEYELTGKAGVSGTGDGPAGQAASGPHLVNLNTATKEQLMTLHGIGETRAEDIIRYREEHGRFEKTEDVMKISGIKDAAFQKIKDYITVSP